MSVIVYWVLSAVFDNFLVVQIGQKYPLFSLFTEAREGRSFLLEALSDVGVVLRA